jgi:hypothetical protein
VNAADLLRAKNAAGLYHYAPLKTWHKFVYLSVKELTGTEPEVWLSCVMQMAKGNR